MTPGAVPEPVDVVAAIVRAECEALSAALRHATGNIWKVSEYLADPENAYIIAASPFNPEIYTCGVQFARRFRNVLAARAR